MKLKDLIENSDLTQFHKSWVKSIWVAQLGLVGVVDQIDSRVD